MGLGSLATVTLADARSKGAECRKLLLEGKDPIVERDATRSIARAEARGTLAFDDCAAAYNPARWRGHLDQLLQAPSKFNAREHHASLPYHAIASFMQALRQQAGVGARALEFVILTAARSGEVRGATWSEVDLKTRVWTVPASRVTAGREHRVPLANAALALLAPSNDAQASDLLFLLRAADRCPT